MERIKAAAVQRSDGVVSIGKNHAEIIASCPYGTCKKGSVKGFITDTGRFVDRYEAQIIAFQSKQINKINKSGLFSEDIYYNKKVIYDPDKGYVSQS